MLHRCHQWARIVGESRPERALPFCSEVVHGWCGLCTRRALIPYGVETEEIPARYKRVLVSPCEIRPI